MLLRTQKFDFGNMVIVFFVVLQQLKTYEAKKYYKNKNCVVE
jgi:cytochrome c1